MEHRDGETTWHFIFRRLEATLFLHIVDVLERVLLENERFEALWVRRDEILSFVLTIDELRSVHPAETGDMSVNQTLLREEELEARLLWCRVSRIGASARSAHVMIIHLAVLHVPPRRHDNAVLVTKLSIVLVLIKDRFETIVDTYELIKLGRADRQN